MFINGMYNHYAQGSIHLSDLLYLAIGAYCWNKGRQCFDIGLKNLRRNQRLEKFLGRDLTVDDYRDLY